MKKNLAYLLLMLGVGGLLLDLVSTWGIIQLREGMIQASGKAAGFIFSEANLIPIYIKVVFIIMVHILAIYFGIKLIRNFTESNPKLEIFSVLILILIVVSLFFIWPIFYQSIGTYRLMKFYNSL